MMRRTHLVAILAAFNEADIIGAAVEHLVRQGAHLYLLDDGSTDGTVEAVRAAAGDRLIGCESLAAPGSGGPSATYQWSRILERKAALASLIDADWFIHQDADEFRESPWPHLTLAEAASLVGRLGWNAIDFEVFNFPPADAFMPGDDPAAIFTHFHPAETFDRIQIRCWRKTGAAVDLVSTGGHEARFPDRRVFPIRFPMRHYPLRTVEQGERKIFRERKGRFDPAEVTRGWHVQYDRYTEGGPLAPDASALRAYDAEAARIALQIKHRLVEDACPAVPATLPADLPLYVRSIETDIVRQAERVRALRRTLAEREHEVETLKARRDELARWLEHALAHVSALEGREREARAEIDLVNRNALDLSRRLDEAFASWSWRLTRPLRAAWRLLGGR
jgi:hypothetical protein